MIYGVKYGSNFVFFICGYPVFPTAFVEKSVLSLWNGLGFLVEDHLTMYARVYFGAFYSICPFLLSLCYCHTVLTTVAL